LVLVQIHTCLHVRQTDEPKPIHDDLGAARVMSDCSIRSRLPTLAAEFFWSCSRIARS
jgi:hypothetical protein